MQGIILKKLSYAEADEIITVLLKDMGLVKFFAKGSRKSKKRYQGRIDHFRHLDFHYKESDNGLWKLFDVDDVKAQDVTQVWQKIENFSFASFLAELICDFVAEADGDHGLFDLWLNLAHDLMQQALSSSLCEAYLIRFYQLTGYGPNLTQCYLCHKEANEVSLIFDERHGHSVCVECVPSFEINDKTPSFLRQLTMFSENIRQKRSKTGEFFLSMLEI